MQNPLQLKIAKDQFMNYDIIMSKQILLKLILNMQIIAIIELIIKKIYYIYIIQNNTI